MGKSFEERRRWFDEHVSRLTCPCCGYPTLDERGADDICLICWWEDDGQDDPDADRVGGPNQGYSLAHARRNLEEHLTMYDRDEAAPFLVEAKKTLIAAFEGLWRLPDPKQNASTWKHIRECERAVFKMRHGTEP